jgi:hypothetical protein
MDPGNAVATRILMSILLDENAKMTDCYYEKKDWRVCKKEVCNATNFSITIITRWLTNS